MKQLNNTEGIKKIARNNRSFRIIINGEICGTQEKEIKGGPAVDWPRLRRTEHGCRGIP
jgi:hypothetical protein